MRISTTVLESYRLFMEPEQEWMSEQDLLDSITGVWKPNHAALLGLAFEAVLEHPDIYRATGGYRYTGRSGDVWEFSDEVIGPCLEALPPGGVWQAKAERRFGAHAVVGKADLITGAQIHDLKTTLGTFDLDKYARSCQWPFYLDIFEGARLFTFHVFCLKEATNGVISLGSIERVNFFPYDAMRRDCEALVELFAGYVRTKGLEAMLAARQVRSDRAGAFV